MTPPRPQQTQLESSALMVGSVSSLTWEVSDVLRESGEKVEAKIAEELAFEGFGSPAAVAEIGPRPQQPVAVAGFSPGSLRVSMPVH